MYQVSTKIKSETGTELCDFVVGDFVTIQCGAEVELGGRGDSPMVRGIHGVPIMQGAANKN